MEAPLGGSNFALQPADAISVLMTTLWILLKLSSFTGYSIRLFFFFNQINEIII